MKKIICFLIISAGLFHAAQAQNMMLQGRIYYERKENMHKQLEEDNEWNEEIKKKMPKYRIDQFELTFNRQQSLYKLFAEDENTAFNWWRIAYNNTVFTDYNLRTQQAEKAVYEKNYLVGDSVPAYEWKLLGEYREIAGYNCRKAATIIMDSLYVIAFYTDEIPVSAGPESFNGLPGMIMGIVVPRLNITYFATKVEPLVVTEKELHFAPAKRSKRVNRKSYLEELLLGVSDWGEYAGKVLFKAIL